MNDNLSLVTVRDETSTFLTESKQLYSFSLPNPYFPCGGGPLTPLTRRLLFTTATTTTRADKLAITELHSNCFARLGDDDDDDDDGSDVVMDVTRSVWSTETERHTESRHLLTDRFELRRVIPIATTVEEKLNERNGARAFLRTAW